MKPWLTLEKTVPTNRREKNKNLNSLIIHNLFNKCSEQLDYEPFWKQVFFSMSKGKFSQGFSFKDGILTFKKRGKMHTIEVPENCIIAINVVKSFLQNHGIFPQNTSEDNKEIKIPLPTWNSIKGKKKQPQIYIEHYICDVSKKHNFNDKTKNIFAYWLWYGINSKRIKSTDIHFDGYRINQIDGININKDNTIILRKRNTKQKKNLDPSFNLFPSVVTKYNNSIKTIYTRKWNRFLERTFDITSTLQNENTTDTNNVVPTTDTNEI